MKAKEAYRILSQWDFTQVKRYLTEREGVSSKKADMLEREYKRFISIVAGHHSPEVQTPISAEVDLFWHTHILFTRDYTNMGRRLGVGYIHHSPAVSKEDLEALKHDFEKNTLNFYQRNFGRIPRKYWSKGSQLCDLDPPRHVVS